jgi:hypothetical protein
MIFSNFVIWPDVRFVCPIAISGRDCVYSVNQGREVATKRLLSVTTS